MNTRMLKCFSLSIMATIFSGCVTLGDFEDYVNENAQRQADTNMAIKILLCESRLDGYEEMIDSDAPTPTRRDEPTNTRRDEGCLEDLGKVIGTNIQNCKPFMTTCEAEVIERTPPLLPITIQECRACFTNCLSSGTWDNVACELP